MDGNPTCACCEWWIKQKDAEIASLRSQIANKNSEIANLRAEVSKLEGRMNQTCPSCKQLKSLLATERDAFGKKETEMAVEIEALSVLVNDANKALLEKDAEIAALKRHPHQTIPPEAEATIKSCSCEAYKAELQSSLSREAKLVEALKEIADPEGHGANPDDWEPMEIAQEALAAHKKEMQP